MFQHLFSPFLFFSFLFFSFLFFSFLLFSFATWNPSTTWPLSVLHMIVLLGTPLSLPIRAYSNTSAVGLQIERAC